MEKRTVNETIQLMLAGVRIAQLIRSVPTQLVMTYTDAEQYSSAQNIMNCNKNKYRRSTSRTSHYFDHGDKQKNQDEKPNKTAPNKVYKWISIYILCFTETSVQRQSPLLTIIV